MFARKFDNPCNVRRVRTQKRESLFEFEQLESGGEKKGRKRVRRK
jgi:hypothetical protein